MKLYNVPIGGKIPELSHFKPQEDERAWPKELAVTALYYTGELTTVTKHSTLTAAAVKHGKPQQEMRLQDVAFQNCFYVVSSNVRLK